jgi:hypothetical protein
MQGLAASKARPKPTHPTSDDTLPIEESEKQKDLASGEIPFVDRE